jgi:ApaG protein
MFSKTSHHIEVSVVPIYLDDESRPDDDHYFWIANRSEQAIRLLSRYWRIVDGNGRVEEVHGEGVVGEQPLIKPNGSYQYTSGCPLQTPHGIMSGHYTMRTAGNELIRVEIPAFSLDSPKAGRRLN